MMGQTVLGVGKESTLSVRAGRRAEVGGTGGEGWDGGGELHSACVLVGGLRWEGTGREGWDGAGRATLSMCAGRRAEVVGDRTRRLGW